MKSNAKLKILTVLALTLSANLAWADVPSGDCSSLGGTEVMTLASALVLYLVAIAIRSTWHRTRVARVGRHTTREQ